MKVNLSICKDEKMKDAVTYHTWWGDVAIFHWSGGMINICCCIFFCSLQEFLGNLGQSLGKDATLSDVLQALDKYYGIVLIFNALSKELYSPNQGLGENVAEYRVCLSQQVQKLQLEYQGRVWPKHVEEIKCDCFYEGLKPEYWWMLAHKVDDENSPGYSDLLLATWNWKKWQRPGILCPKDSCNKWIECDAFWDHREFIPIVQAEG